MRQPNQTGDYRDGATRIDDLAPAHGNTSPGM